MKKHLFRFLLLGLVIFLIVITIIIGLAGFVDANEAIGSVQAIISDVGQNRLLSLIIFIGIFALITTIYTPSVFFMIIIGGYIFGTIPGALASNFGATIGSFFAFLIARYLFGGYVHRRLEKRLKNFETNLKRNGINYLLFLRLAPVIPTFLINIFAGVTKTNKRTFLWTTSLGNLPADFVYAFAGSQLKVAGSSGNILSVNLVLALAAIGVAALVPLFLRRHPEKYLS